MNNTTEVTPPPISATRDHSDLKCLFKNLEEEKV